MDAGGPTKDLSLPSVVPWNGAAGLRGHSPARPTLITDAQEMRSAWSVRRSRAGKEKGPHMHAPNTRHHAVEPRTQKPAPRTSRPLDGVVENGDISWLDEISPRERESNMILDWFEAEALRPTTDMVAALCAKASALTCELGELVRFESGREALAFALLDDFARARGLNIGELSMLVVEPIDAAKRAVRALMRDHDDLVIELARINRAIDIRKRGEEGDLTRRRDRGQVRRDD